MMGWVDETGGVHGVVRSDSWTSFGQRGNFHVFFCSGTVVPIPGLEGLERIITGKATKGWQFGRTDDLSSELLFAGFILETPKTTYL